MRTASYWMACLAWAPAYALAGDILTLKNGERLACTITGAKDDQITVLLQPVGGKAPLPFSINRNQALSMDFGDDPARNALLRDAAGPQTAQLRELWNSYAPLLATKGAPGGRIGLRLGLLLLNGGDVALQNEALAVFERISTQAHSQIERDAAEQGKLRALKALGRPLEAISAAEKFLNTKKGGSLWAESSMTVAEGLASELTQLLEDNPRWDLDEVAGKERTRLYHAALDLFLLPALCPDVSQDLAVRGLWGALKVHRLCNAPERAAELARDIVSLHPGTKQADDAAVILKSMPAEVRAPTTGPTKQARKPEEIHPDRLPNPYEEAKTNLVADAALPLPAPAPKRRKRGGDGNKQKPAGSLP